MADLPRSSPYRSTPDVPVDDDRRAELGRRLNEAFAAGDLDEADYRTRLDTLYAARTLGELAPVVTGLPALEPGPTPALVAQTGRPGELRPGRGARLAPTAVLLAVVSVLGAATVVLVVLSVLGVL